VHHGHRHEQHVVRAVAQVLGHGAHVVGVFVVEARNDLGHAGGAARELEHRHLERVLRHLCQQHLCGLPRGAGDEVTQVQGGVALRTARLHDPLQAGDALAHARHERHVVELRIVALHEGHACGGVVAEVADLLLPVRGQRAHRDQARLQAAPEAQHQLDAVADLEDHPVQGAQAQPQEGPAQAVRERVEFGIGVAGLDAAHRNLVGVGAAACAQGLGQGFVAQQAGVDIAAQVGLGRVDHAGQRVAHADGGGGGHGQGVSGVHRRGVLACAAGRVTRPSCPAT
jgi:hypothetical protein